MLNEKKILAVVPARAGSKGIPDKNIKTVGGIPLVARVGEVLKELGEIDRAVVSTDSDCIAAVAESAGIAAPFRRPEALSGDRIGDLDVLTHALQTMEAIDGRQYDVVVMLQPTSPLRTAQNVRDCLQKMVDEKLDAVWTVSETDSKNHPLKQLTVGEKGELGYYDPAGGAVIARQQLKPLYHRNGIAYVISRECLLGQETIMGKRTAGLIVQGPHVRIDTMWDLALVEFILSSNRLSVDP
jgi:CMP-N,N'-diacetyllegionaminic acid synthase